MRKEQRLTRRMKEVEEAFGAKLEDFLPDLVTDLGLTGASKQIGVSKSILGYWLLKFGIERHTVALAPGDKLTLQRVNGSVKTFGVTSFEGRVEEPVPPVYEHGSEPLWLPKDQIVCSQDVYDLMGPKLQGLVQEQMHILVLNNRHHVLADVIVYQGTASSADVRISELLRPAVLANAPALLAVHNHPSGMVTPSEGDRQVTRDLMKAAELLDIECLDHIIIGDGYSSVRKEMDL